MTPQGFAGRVAAGEFAGFPLLEWIPLSLRPAAELARASSLAFAVALAACAAHQALPDDPAGRLFARSLDEITDLCITPVSSRKLILAGAARFSRLDNKFSVTETPGPEGRTQIVLNYDGREVAAIRRRAVTTPTPGGLMGRLIASCQGGVANPRRAFGRPDRQGPVRRHDRRPSTVFRDTHRPRSRATSVPPETASAGSV